MAVISVSLIWVLVVASGLFCGFLLRGVCVCLFGLMLVDL